MQVNLEMLFVEMRNGVQLHYNDVATNLSISKNVAFFKTIVNKLLYQVLHIIRDN